MSNNQPFRNRQAIAHATVCGCYCCLRVFLPSQIKRWTDNGETALCPYCEIDAVLSGNEDQPLDAGQLTRLHNQSIKVSSLLTGEGRMVQLRNGESAQVFPADGERFALCASTDGRHFLRAYREDKTHEDFALAHSDMAIMIDDGDVFVYRTADGKQWIDHAPETLGLVIGEAASPKEA